MAISATFYSFSKRKNSTKQPTGSGDSYSVTLKSGTSIISPTLLLNIASRPSYNYLSFEGRYYFVTDIVSVRTDLWEISCTVDALATWKSEIGSTSADILYATGGRDDIVDGRIPVESGIHVDSNVAGITGDFTACLYKSDDPPGIGIWLRNLIQCVFDEIMVFHFGIPPFGGSIHRGKSRYAISKEKSFRPVANVIK